MGLKETIKETKEKLEKAVEVETKADETALEALNKTVAEVIEEPKKDEKKPDEIAKEESKKEEVKAVEIKPEVEKTSADFAKERVAKKREKDQLAEKLAEANARIAALEASAKPVEARKETVVDPEPDKTINGLAWAEWKIRQQDKKIDNLSGWKAEQDTVKSREDLRTRAQREVEVFETQVRQSAPDYDDVKNYYGSMLATSIRIVNPKITQPQLIEAVNNRLLTRASELLAEGYENPIEAMYLEAKALGYQPKQTKETEKEEPKPDLDKVSNFRKRNAGIAGSSGSNGEGDVSAKVAATMTNAQFAKLKPDQKKRIFESLRG